jgi:hypothetical protein
MRERAHPLDLYHLCLGVRLTHIFHIQTLLSLEEVVFGRGLLAHWELLDQKVDWDAYRSNSYTEKPLLDGEAVVLIDMKSLSSEGDQEDLKTQDREDNDNEELIA